ncbi:mucin-5AC [Colossoma macropomum]|uniref:mucin-5AC n=1 Tax=Colossoma macropomum TaxID=42526 RepID=UPI0018644091|nr:mucin-5AC [Colossoma macropomum]
MSGGKKRSGFQITSVTSDYNQTVGESSGPKVPVSPETAASPLMSNGAQKDSGDQATPTTAMLNGPSFSHTLSPTLQTYQTLSQPSTPVTMRKQSSLDQTGAGGGASRFRVVRLGQGLGEPYKRGRWTCVDVMEREAEERGLRRVIDSMRHAHSLESLETVGLGGAEGPVGGAVLKPLGVRGLRAGHMVHSQGTTHQLAGYRVDAAHSGPPSPTHTPTYHFRATRSQPASPGPHTARDGPFHPTLTPIQTPSALALAQSMFGVGGAFELVSDESVRKLVSVFETRKQPRPLPLPPSHSSPSLSSSLPPSHSSQSPTPSPNPSSNTLQATPTFRSSSPVLKAGPANEPCTPPASGTAPSTWSRPPCTPPIPHSLLGRERGSDGGRQEVVLRGNGTGRRVPRVRLRDSWPIGRLNCFEENFLSSVTTQNKKSAGCDQCPPAFDRRRLRLVRFTSRPVSYPSVTPDWACTASTTGHTTRSTSAPRSTSTTGPKSNSNTGPKSTSTTGPKSTSTTGPKSTSNRGPKSISTTGLKSTSSTGPKSISAIGDKSISTTGPKSTSTTGPTSTSTTGPKSTSTTGPKSTSTTGPKSTSNTGPKSISTTGPKFTYTTGTKSTSTTEPTNSSITGTKSSAMGRDYTSTTGPKSTSTIEPTTSSITGTKSTSTTGSKCSSTTGPATASTTAPKFTSITRPTTDVSDTSAASGSSGSKLSSAIGTEHLTDSSNSEPSNIYTARSPAGCTASSTTGTNASSTTWSSPGSVTGTNSSSYTSGTTASALTCTNASSATGTTSSSCATVSAASSMTGTDVSSTRGTVSIAASFMIETDSSSATGTASRSCTIVTAANSMTGTNASCAIGFAPNQPNQGQYVGSPGNVPQRCSPNRLSEVLLSSGYPEKHIPSGACCGSVPAGGPFLVSRANKRLFEGQSWMPRCPEQLRSASRSTDASVAPNKSKGQEKGAWLKHKQGLRPSDSAYFSLLLFLRSGSSGSMIAIDNKIEQAMDLVKAHLMLAVREEVDVLREQIKELSERNAQLERENYILRALRDPH